MDPLLIQFLQMIQLVLNTGGNLLKEKEYNLKITSKGLFSVNFDKFLSMNPDIKTFLIANNKKAKVTAILDHCQVSYSSNNSSKQIHFSTASMEALTFHIDEFMSVSAPIFSSSTQTEIQPTCNVASQTEFFPSDLKICHDKTKDDYTSRHLVREYESTGIKAIENSLDVILNNDGWNRELKGRCVKKLICSLTKNHLGASPIIDSHNQAITKSLNSFLSELSNGGRSMNQVQRSINTVIAACTFESELSSHAISAVIGSKYRKQITKIRKINSTFCDIYSDMENEENVLVVDDWNVVNEGEDEFSEEIEEEHYSDDEEIPNPKKRKALSIVENEFTSRSQVRSDDILLCK